MNNCEQQYPVNLMYTKQTCKEECSFNFDYNKNSSCMATNKGDYLEIKVDGHNNVLFNNFKVRVKNFRMYQPSLHLFNGLKADAEMIIEHKGAKHTLLVCIPITSSDNYGNSNRFFHQFIPVIPSADDEPKHRISVNNWSLNSVVPDAPFYFYSGPLPYPPCDGTNSIIVFSKDHGITINPDDYDTLQNAITSVTLSDKKRLKAIAKNTTMVMFNKTGSQPPGAATKGHVIFEDCQPIDGMGGKTKKDSPAQKGGGAPAVLYTLFLLVGVLALAAAIKYLCGAVPKSTGGEPSFSGGGRSFKGKYK